MSESIKNLANDILACPEWDPEHIHSPNKDKIPAAAILPNNIPFGPALPANVAIPPSIQGKVDCYINNLTPMVLHIGNNAIRGENAVPLAMHTVGHPVHNDKTIPRNNLIYFRKLYGEGKLEEIKIVTGWGIYTHRFIVFMTDDKQLA